MSYTLGAVFEIRDKFSATLKNANEKVNKFKDNTEEAGRGIDRFRSGIARGVKSVAKFGAGVAGAGAAVVGAGTAMANSFSNTTEEIVKASQKAGVHTDTLQELRYAFGELNVEQGDLQRALERTNQRMGRAARGNENYQNALKELGVPLEQVKKGTIDTDEAFMTAIDTLSNMESAQERSALAGELFGTQLSRRLLPAIEEGGDAIEELRKEFDDLDIGFSEEDIELGQKWSDATDDLKLSWQGVYREIQRNAMPIMVGLAERGLPLVERGIERVSDTLSWIGGIGTRVFNSIRDAVSENQPTIDRVRDTVSDFGERLNGAFSGSEGIIDWFVNDAIPKGVDVVGDLVDRAVDLYDWTTDNWSRIEPVVVGIVGAMAAWRAITLAQATVTGIMTAAQVGLNAAMLANPIGLVVAGIGVLIGVGYALYRNWDSVREKGLELWDRLSVLRKEFLAMPIVQIVKRGIDLIQNWDEVREKASQVRERVGEVFTNVRESITNSMETAKEKVTDFFSPFTDFIDDVRERWDNLVGRFTDFEMPSIGLPKWMGGDGLLSFDVGTDRVPHDMVAKIHKDEMIVPAKQSKELRQKGVGINNITDRLKQGLRLTSGASKTKDQSIQQSKIEAVHHVPQPQNAQRKANVVIEQMLIEIGADVDMDESKLKKLVKKLGDAFAEEINLRLENM